jgi:outer membrane protein TolC
MKKTLLLACPLFLFGVSVDFDISLSKTVQNNQGLKAKKLSIEEAKLSLQEAKGYNYGNLVFAENVSRTNNAGYVFGMKLASREATFGDFGFKDFLAWQQNRNGDVLKIQPDDLNNPEARTNYETKLTYKLPIFTGYKLSSAKKMAKLQILANSAKYNFDKKQLELEVLKAYNGAVIAKEFIKATKEAKKATSSFVNFASELYNEGLVTSIDVKQAQVYDMGVDSQYAEAQNKFDLAISYLKFLTSDENIDDVKDFRNITISKKNLSLLQEEANSKRDDFKWMQYNTQTMKHKIDYDNSDNYPMVGAQVEYGFNDDKFSINSDKDYYLGAVGLTYTLFSGSVNSVKKQKAKIAYNKTKHYLDYMKNGIKLEIEKNYLTLQTKQKVFLQKQKAEALAQEVLEQSQEMYKNHLINMSNLLMQQANHQKAKAEMIFAKYEQTLAMAKLKISLGESIK